VEKNGEESIFTFDNAEIESISTYRVKLLYYIRYMVNINGKGRHTIIEKPKLA